MDFFVEFIKVLFCLWIVGFAYQWIKGLVWRWLLAHPELLISKFMIEWGKKKIPTFIKVWLWIIGIPFSIAFIWWAYWSYTIDYASYRGKKFSKENWIADREINEGYSLFDIGERCKMYQDLVNNYIKKGMTARKVEELLGPSDKDYCLYKKVKCFRYLLGICYANSLTVVSDDLFICFNEKQEVIAWGRGEFFTSKICDYKLAYCELGKPASKCECYTKKGSGMPDAECPHEIEMW